jgi:hypothetical protein
LLPHVARRRARTWGTHAAFLPLALLLSACAVELDPSPPPFPGRPPPQPAVVAAPAPEPTTREEIRIAMYRWFIAAGYKPFQAAALLDHARYESNYRLCARGPGGYRYLFQWGGLRLQRLRRFAATEGCPPLTKQLAFADDELRNDPKFSCFLHTTSKAAALNALRRGFGRGSC